MLIPKFVTACDGSCRVYATPVLGAAAIAQGATGRWCEVLWFGPEYVKENNMTSITREEAIKEIESKGNGSIDF